MSEASELERKVERLKKEIEREVYDRLPRKVGIVAVNHFKLYKTFCVEKPENYEQMKAEKQAEKEALRQQFNARKDEDGKKEADEKEKPSDKSKTSFKQRLKGFFGIAPETDGAASDF